jgi:hypothetical protein
MQKPPGTANCPALIDRFSLEKPPAADLPRNTTKISEEQAVNH